MGMMEGGQVDQALSFLRQLAHTQDTSPDFAFYPTEIRTMLRWHIREVDRAARIDELKDILELLAELSRDELILTMRERIAELEAQNG